MGIRQPGGEALASCQGDEGMTGVKFYLCAVPAEMWRDSHTFSTLVEDALSIEGRIAREVNLETERTRYGVCCQQIEATVRAKLDPIKGTADLAEELEKGFFPALEFGGDYLDIVQRIVSEPRLEQKARKCRLGASFFPPDILEDHISIFEQLAKKAEILDHPVVRQRLAFFRAAEEKGCGVVEVQDVFGSGPKIAPTAGVRVKAAPGQKAEREGPLVAEYVSRPAREEKALYDILHLEIERAITGGGAVNFSNQPHNIITEVLREFVVAQPDESPTQIRVVYRDGSEAEPFPLRCLAERNPEEVEGLLNLRPLSAALISMRHLDMDRLVDIAWFRNVEASRLRAFAETDAFCCEKTVKQLEKVEGRLLLHLYHTGLEPAVVGFYRGLVKVLREREEAGIAVIPFYYFGPEGYRRGTPWY